MIWSEVRIWMNDCTRIFTLKGVAGPSECLLRSCCSDFLRSGSRSLCWKHRSPNLDFGNVQLMEASEAPIFNLQSVAVGGGFPESTSTEGKLMSHLKQPWLKVHWSPLKSELGLQQCAEGQMDQLNSWHGVVCRTSLQCFLVVFGSRAQVEHYEFPSSNGMPILGLLVNCELIL